MRTGKPKRGFGGFTLIELMITLVVITILLAIAFPSYERIVVRANRAEAIEALLTAAACQERLFIRNNAFDANACAGATNNGHYLISVATPNGGQNFVLTATPQNNQVKDDCGVLTLDDRGLRTASSETGERAQNCWSGRWGGASS